VTTTLAAGLELTTERTFTAQLVEGFAAVSGDRGSHHTAAAPGERVIVHGLLVASLATELGGRIDFLARTMSLEFLRPVFVGDTVRCTLRITSAEPAADRTRLQLDGAGVNQDGTVVMRVSSAGIVRQHPG
jgi:3-hydroxybutyryl-CoA dehydratase